MAYIIDEEVPYQDPHSRGTGSIVTQRKSYILRTRGEHNRLVRHDFECPVHGVFEARMPSGEVPDMMPCPSGYVGIDLGFSSPYPHVRVCEQPSPYCVPTVAQGIAAGSVKC